MKIKRETAIKIVAAALAVLALVTCMQSTVFASGDALNFSAKDLEAKNSSAANATQNVAGIILGVVKIIAIAVAVIFLIVLAIKYISSSPNDKAELKKNMIVYAVGAVLLFGAAGILQLVQNFADDAFNNGTNTGK